MKGRNDRFTISIYLLPLFLAVFLTACEVRDSYMNAEVISADETSITVRSIKAGDSHAPRGVLEAETLILDLTGYDSVSIPEGLAPGDGIRVLFNPDSFKKGEVPEIGIVFQIYRLDEDGEVVISHEEISASESSKAPEPGRPVKWFDCLHGDEMVWDDVREYDLEEFPETTFRWSAEQLEAVKGSEITPLYNGMPIWSVYFCDLTGDGKPELCSTPRVLAQESSTTRSWSMTMRKAPVMIFRTGGILIMSLLYRRILLLLKKGLIRRMRSLSPASWCSRMVFFR